MKILALDLGDVHTGTALSDSSKIIAQPYKTFATYTLVEDLKQLFSIEDIDTVVVGKPITMKGKESEQTKKAAELTEQLKSIFSNKEFVLWDERCTSSQAASLKKIKTKEDKRASHSLAAALILTGYLEHLRMKAFLNDLN